MRGGRPRRVALCRGGSQRAGSPGVQAARWSLLRDCCLPAAPGAASVGGSEQQREYGGKGRAGRVGTVEAPAAAGAGRVCAPGSGCTGESTEVRQNTAKNDSKVTPNARSHRKRARLPRGSAMRRPRVLWGSWRRPSPRCDLCTSADPTSPSRA